MAAASIALVLLGESGSGKSASGNTILGDDKFASKATAGPLTTECKKEEGEVSGRRVTVIDTPDFFHEDLEESERHVGQCREMCEGQECVYLLVIKIGRFTETERDILKRLRKKLGKIIDRTIILFTYGDDLKGQSIDDYVKNTNKHLQKMIVECGERYEVFNNKDREKCGWQVERLMEQVHRVSVEDKNKGKEGKGGGKEVGSGAGTLQHRPPRQSQPAQSSLALVLVGEFGSGKSASGNTILGEDKFASRATAEPLTTRCQKEEGDVYGTRVTVIDTPDFFDQDLKKPQKECREMCEGHECVYLLVIQIGRFTEGERYILQRLENKLGKIRDKTIILFTFGDDLKGQRINDYVRNTNPHLQKLIGECGERYHVFNNKICDKKQVEELMEKISAVPQEPERSKSWSESFFKYLS